MIAIPRPQSSQVSFPDKDITEPVSFSSQAISSHKAPTPTNDGRYLLVSPYDEQDHLLDLQTVDTANQLLATALVHLQCQREDYATAPYIDIFNWQEVFHAVQQLVTANNYNWKEQSFYIVVFRSQIPPTTIYEDLGLLDKAAHAEATRSGGFLKYWFGSPDESGRNLATCVWRSLHDARIGSVGEAHRLAAGAARKLYTEWHIERLRLTIKDAATDWEISQWVD
ncbi:hypothetical protein BP6252_09917 [Coleophoma cylindrospora]|uniref:Uncharacterized protein n=1 Tax=Coleophoma cylindrospora TaxID=1849047 RepID=A0A3D8QWW7_9HELO|nr:hypothetical protein BP6252_09917 [Coleophoma cylindrospora]